MRKTLFIISLMTSVLIFSGCGEETTSDPNEREVTNAEESATEEETTEEVEVAEEVVEAEAPAVEPVGTRSSPLPLGDTISVKGNIFDSESNALEATIDLTLTEVIRGQEAWDIILAENEFNETPPEGYEYVLAKVKGAVTKADTENDSFLLSSYDFQFVSAEGTVYEQVSAVVPNELFAELYNGGAAEGYAYNTVKVDDDFKISYQPSEGSPVFFEVK